MWKRLIGRPLKLVSRDCIPLITAIFSDRNEIRVVRDLHRDDAQAFINIIDKVPSTYFHLGRTGPLTST